MFTLTDLEKLHKRELSDLYAGGTPTRAEEQYLADLHRARHALRVAEEQGKPRASTLKEYWVPQAIAVMLLGDAVDYSIKRKLTMADKYRAIESWCLDNALSQVRLDDLAEVSGLSTSSVRKYIDSRSDLFRTIKRGYWEVRDVKAERAAK